MLDLTLSNMYDAKTLFKVPRLWKKPTISDESFPKIGNYEFLSVLGRGGMGVVCKYRNATLNKNAAVKMIVSKELSEAAMVRFQREGQATAKLQHPGIVAVHDLGVTEAGAPYLLMDYYEGETLEQLLNRKYQFSIPELETIFVQCAAAMQHAHEQGVLHRDLKPSNIMVTNLKGEQPIVKILDFGIAKILDENGEFTTTVGLNAGSPLFMSPEQSQGSPLDARADIYSLGCVFYATLVGNPPFKGKNSLELALQHQKEQPLPISQIPHLKSCPHNISNTIMRMLEKDPWNRPQTMKEVCALLKKKKPSGSERRNRNNSFWIIVAVAVVVSAIAIAMISSFVISSNTQKSSRQLLDPISHASYEEVKNLFPSMDPYRSRLAPLVQQTPQPTEITLNNSFLKDSDLSVLLLDQNLKRLTLVRNSIGDVGMRIFAGCSVLEKLNLEANHSIGNEGLKDICHSRSITELNLKNTSVTDAGMPYLAQMSQMKVLILDETNITDAGVAILRSLKNLDSLHIAVTGATEATLLDAPELFPQLRELKVGGDRITARGLRALRRMPALRELSLNHCANQGKAEIAEVVALKNVTNFESGEDCNDADVAQLCERDNWAALRLTGAITDRGLEILSRQKHLEEVVIVGNRLASMKAIEAFHRKNGRCKLVITPSPRERVSFTPTPEN